MTKAQQFDAITSDFMTMAANANLYKDEAIQAAGERYMGFIIENHEFISKALHEKEEREAQ